MRKPWKLNANLNYKHAKHSQRCITWHRFSCFHQFQTQHVLYFPAEENSKKKLCILVYNILCGEFYKDPCQNGFSLKNKIEIRKMSASGWKSIYLFSIWCHQSIMFFKTITNIIIHKYHILQTSWYHMSDWPIRWLFYWNRQMKI